MDRVGENITVGGIQNYLVRLAQALENSEKKVYIYQTADLNFNTKYKGVKIKGVKTDSNKSTRKQIKVLYKVLSPKLHQNDIVIFGTDKIAFKNGHKKTLAIQHGISFDYIDKDSLWNLRFFRSNLFSTLYKVLQCGRAIWEFKRCENVVCVDYNFLNWIRTVIPRKHSQNVFVVPNFASTSIKENIVHRNDKIIKVLFARRFEYKRGVPILIPLIKKVLSNYNNVKFTISGEGKMEQILRQELNDFPEVEFTKFRIGESEEINLNHHITLIPTYGSEGTSFSLLEGMAAGAIPIASNVGGMTNILINGFNGYLVNPNVESFYEAITQVIERSDLRKSISVKAKETIDFGFSKTRWESNWINVIQSIENLSKN